MNIMRCLSCISPVPAALGILAIIGIAPVHANPTLPPGYFLVTFATGVPNPTSMAFGPDGWLYVTQVGGTVTALKDVDGNGSADSTVTFATGFSLPLGVTVRNGQLYVSQKNRVTRLTDTNGDRVADLYEHIITNLPSGKHWTTGLAFGPDDNLYVGLGSSSNRGVPAHPWQATILKFTPDGTFLSVVATGLRNPYGLAFNYAGQLFATDNGAGPDSAWNCLEAPDELNWIETGGNYGFPTCFGVGDCADVSAYCNPVPCGANDCETGSGCTPQMKAPIALFDAHSSSDGLAFGDNFAGYSKHDLFVAQFGQTELIDGCFTSFGHRIVKVRIRKQGNKWKADPPEDFVTCLDLPLDVAIGPDGAMYIAEYGLGKILRLSQSGPTSSPGPPDRTLLPHFRFVPNPALHEARAEWATDPAGPVRFQVFDILGRRVTDLGVHENGRAVWNLADRSGRRVAPGLYFIEAASGGSRAVTRLVIPE